jgi:hypothetical protein
MKREEGLAILLALYKRKTGRGGSLFSLSRGGRALLLSFFFFSVRLADDPAQDTGIFYSCFLQIRKEGEGGHFS